LPGYSRPAAFNRVFGLLAEFPAAPPQVFRSLIRLAADELTGLFPGLWSEQHSNRQAQAQSERKKR
jgi:hypothetical protein